MILISIFLLSRMEQVNKEAYGQIRKWTRYTNQFHFLLLLRKHMEDKTMCEAGYDLKLLLKTKRISSRRPNGGKVKQTDVHMHGKNYISRIFHKVGFGKKLIFQRLQSGDMWRMENVRYPVM